MARILIADDDPNVRSVVHAALDKAGFKEVVEVQNGRTALRQLAGSSFDIALLDLRMPPPDGLEVLRELRGRNIQTDVIMFSAVGTIKDGIESTRLGARDFLEKPLDFNALLRLVHGIIEERHPTRHPLAQAMDEFVARNATNPKLSAACTAAHFNLSPAYVRKLFRENLGVSFGRRLTYHRVRLAKRMIANTDESLGNISKQTGFKHQNRLTQSFRKMEGTTPSQYRKKCIIRGES